MKGEGFRVQGLRFRVQGLGFRVKGLRLRISGLGLRTLRLRFTFGAAVKGSGLRVYC